MTDVILLMFKKRTHNFSLLLSHFMGGSKRTTYSLSLAILDYNCQPMNPQNRPCAQAACTIPWMHCFCWHNFFPGHSQIFSCSHWGNFL